MGVGEKHPAVSKSIDVRGIRLRVPAKAPHPVIQVIHCDEQDIRLMRILGVRSSPKETREKQYQWEPSHLAHFLRPRERSDFGLNSGVAFFGSHLARRWITV
jgi:hypothetical protein